MKRFRNLTHAQTHIFGLIAINSDGGHNPAMLKKLADAGLIVGHDEFDGIGSVRRWRVPVAVHMEWCAWCAENAEAEVGSFRDTVAAMIIMDELSLTVEYFDLRPQLHLTDGYTHAVCEIAPVLFNNELYRRHIVDDLVYRFAREKYISK